MRPLALLAFGLALLLLPLACSGERRQESGFLDRTVVVDGTEFRYQVYVPPEFNPHKSWPVILFLHSVSQRGDDGLQPSDFGLAHTIRTARSRFPFVIVFPQCRKDSKWVYPVMQRVVLAELEAALHDFHGDRRRVYLTGMSMGGFGVWEMAAQYPGRFAAYVVVCGGIFAPPKVPDARVTLAADPAVADPYAETARRIGKTPVWIFHGSEDPVVSVEGARRMASALKTQGGNLRYTEYAGMGHEIWDAAYGEPDLVPWLFAAQQSH